ncbi:hypothetical protein TNCV_3547571 [Trichonephila clavipes]|nr:hypothetical protein TNCV_3547571 [Trichonephila clavipes]
MFKTVIGSWLCTRYNVEEWIGELSEKHLAYRAFLLQRPKVWRRVLQIYCGPHKKSSFSHKKKSSGCDVRTTGPPLPIHRFGHLNSDSLACLVHNSLVFHLIGTSLPAGCMGEPR